MERTRAHLKSWQRWSLLIAGAGVLACAAVSWDQPEQLWQAYLFAFLACWLVTMGGSALAALGNLTGGRWALVARPFYLAAAQTIPLVAILFVPIAMSVEQIFPWALTGASELDMPRGKAVYLETTFFQVRAIGYFVVWLGVVWWLSLVSRPDRLPADTLAMRRAGALSLVLLVPTTTFAAFDWGMSLEPHWYSSIYGAILTAGGVLAVHALAITCLATADGAELAALVAPPGGDGTEPLAATPNEPAPSADTSPNDSAVIQRAAEVTNDLGNLLLAFLMVTTYFAFSQFLIIWSGNLPSEITWYLRRLSGGWQWLGLAVVVLHFVVPFLMLLSRDLKRSARRLSRVALLLLVMYNVHLYWNIVPAFADDGLRWHAANVAALAALGAGWLAAFIWHANRYLAACRIEGASARRDGAN